MGKRRAAPRRPARAATPSTTAATPDAPSTTAHTDDGAAAHAGSTTTTTTTTTAAHSASALSEATRERLQRYEHSKAAQPAALAPVVLGRSDGLHEVLSASARRGGGGGNVPLVRIKRRLLSTGAVAGGGGGGGGEDHTSAGDDDDDGDDDGDNDDDDGGCDDDDDDDDDANGCGRDDGNVLGPLVSTAFPALAGAHNIVETLRRQQQQSARVETLERSAQAARQAAVLEDPAAAAAAAAAATEPRPATQRRPRFRETGRLARDLQHEHRTLSTTTIASFDLLRREFSSVLDGGGAGRGTHGAEALDVGPGGADDGTGIAVPQEPGERGAAEITAFYRALLEQEPHWIAATKAADALSAAAVPTMPALDAAYCRAYLREAHSGRRPCMRAASERCVAQALLEHPRGPFALMELLTPAEDALFRRSGELPAASRLCLACVRHYVGYRWNKAKLNAHVSPVTLNPHTNVVGVPGGYRLTACIQQVPGTADGIYGTIRHFDVSEFEPCEETLADNTTVVRGYNEAAATFF